MLYVCIIVLDYLQALILFSTDYYINNNTTLKKIFNTLEVLGTERLIKLF